MLVTHATVQHIENARAALLLIAAVVTVFWRIALRVILAIVIVAVGAGALVLLSGMHLYVRRTRRSAVLVGGQGQAAGNAPARTAGQHGRRSTGGRSTGGRSTGGRSTGGRSTGGRSTASRDSASM
jgi:uncharacterized membrane protein YgcG